MKIYKLKILLVFSVSIFFISNGFGEEKSALFSHNIVSNPSAETGENNVPTGWKTRIDRAAPNFIWDNKEAKTGHYSLKIKGPGAGCWYTTLPIQYGKKYRVSFYFKSRSTREFNPEANLFACLIKEGKNGAGALQWVNNFSMRTISEWSKVCMIDYVAKEGDKELRLELWLNGNRSKISPDETSEVWFDDLAIEERDCPPAKIQNFLLLKNENFDVITSPGTENIFKNDNLSDSPKIDSIKLNAGRGETRGFQITVRPHVQLDRVKWEGENFTGPASFSRKNIKNYRVEYISLPRKEIPGPLPDEDLSKLRVNENNPFYFLIKIPENTKKGIYKTNIKLKNGNNVIVSVPLELKVWDFTIPRNPSMEMVADLWYHILPHYEKGEMIDINKRYLSNLVEHRAVTALGGLKAKIVEKKPLQKEIELDSKNFEASIRHLHQLGVCKNVICHWYSFNFYNNTFMGIPIFKNAEGEENNPHFNAIFDEMIKKINGLLDKEGCRNSFEVAISDEPDIHNRSVVRFIKGVAKSFKAADPRIRVFSTGILHKDFAPYFDRWYFNNLRIPFAQEEIKMIERKGTKGIYLNNITDPSVPPLKLRMLVWALWKEHYAGFLWLQINGWGRNTPKGFVKDNPWEGKFKGIVFIYPPREGKSEEGPINSLHWEALREGMEDIEYFNMLKKLLKDKRGQVPESLLLQGQKALDRVNEIVDHVPIGGETWSDTFYSPDVALIEEVRREIAQKIEEINSYRK